MGISKINTLRKMVWFCFLTTACSDDPSEPFQFAEELSYSVTDDRMVLKLTYQGVTSTHSLVEIAPLLDPEADMEIDTDDGVEQIKIAELDTSRAFMTQLQDGGSVVTLYDDGTLSGVILHDGRPLQVEDIATRLESQKAFSQATTGVISKSLAPYTIDDLSAGTQSITDGCGVKSTQGNETTHALDAFSDSKRATIDPVNARRRFLEGLEPNTYYPYVCPDQDTPCCYPGEDTIRRVSIGVAVDWKFYQDNGGSKVTSKNTKKVTRALTLAVMAAARNFATQLHIIPVIAKTKIVGKKSNNGNVLSDKNNCNESRAEKLDRFKAYMSKYSGRNGVGHWHLFSGCPIGGGLAYVAAIGTSSYNVGLTSATGHYWATFGHELGHAFGAYHLLTPTNTIVTETNGGLMGYGDKYYNGIVQFAHEHKSEVCNHLSNIFASGTPSYFKAVKPNNTCGNMLLEEGEQCECLNGSTSCAGCPACTLSNQAQLCSAGTFVMRTTAEQESQNIISVDELQLSAPECCQNSGKTLKDTATTCSHQAGGGVCVEGECVNICYENGMDFCSVSTPHDGCRMACSRPNLACSTEWQMASGFKMGYMPDGVACGNGSGTCSNGSCSAD